MTYDQHEQHSLPPSGSSNSDQRSLSIAELLNRAKISIQAGEHSLHQAAEDIAAASERGTTQREIAQTVGKSLGWVNGLLKWRSAGYPDTAFGPASKAKRARAAAMFRRPEQTKTTTKSRPASTSEQARAEKAKAEAATAKANAARAKAEAATAKAEARKAKAEADAREKKYIFEMMGGRRKKPIHSSTRDLLIKALGMLGSDQAGERDNAALMAEKLRKKINMSWEELIIPAA
jgi:hypothetical protein